jgi:Family of unknown function (DUF5723)
MYGNPANIVDTRYKLFVNVIAADIFVGNNAVKWNAPYSFLKFFVESSLPNKRIVWKSNYLTAIENNRKKNMNMLVDARGPAFLYSIDSKQSAAIAIRGRGGLSFSKVSPQLATLIQYGSNSKKVSVDERNLNLSLNMNAFTEIGFTYAKDISINSEEAIKVGMTVKRVIGLTNFHAIAKESDYNVVTVLDPDNPPVGTIDSVLNLRNINIKYGNSDENSGFDSFSFKPGYWFGTPSPGRGFGFDIGLSYEHRPYIQKYSYKEKGVQKWDQTQNKYEYKVGFSLIDIGRVNFNNPTYVSNYETYASDKLVFKNSLRKPLPSKRLVEDLSNVLDINTTTNDLNQFYANLPTTFQTYIDYKIKEHVYVYATWVQNLRAGNSLGMRTPSLVSVVPRYESKWIDVAMPISLLNDFQLFTVGFSTRLGPLFIGSDNLQGLFNIANPRGMDFYAGLNIPLFSQMPKSSTKCAYENQDSKIKTAFKKIFKKN